MKLHEIFYRKCGENVLEIGGTFGMVDVQIPILTL